MLEPCMENERVCITRPKGVPDEYFYLYSGVIEDFKIHIPFTYFESGLLKTLNVAPFQLRPNEWGFIKAFEIIYEALNIIPTLFFFFFFELKWADKVYWSSLNGITGKHFLYVYTTNYKGFKDKFLRVRSGKRCP